MLPMACHAWSRRGSLKPVQSNAGAVRAVPGLGTVGACTATSVSIGLMNISCQRSYACVALLSPDYFNVCLVFCHDVGAGVAGMLL
jgi:hypothetical protein